MEEIVGMDDFTDDSWHMNFGPLCSGWVTFLSSFDLFFEGFLIVVSSSFVLVGIRLLLGFLAFQATMCSKHA